MYVCIYIYIYIYIWAGRLRLPGNVGEVTGVNVDLLRATTAMLMISIMYYNVL